MESTKLIEPVWVLNENGKPAPDHLLNTISFLLIGDFEELLYPQDTPIYVASRNLLKLRYLLASKYYYDVDEDTCLDAIGVIWMYLPSVDDYRARKTEEQENHKWALSKVEEAMVAECNEST